MLIKTVEDIDRHLGPVRKAAAAAHAWVAAQTGDPIDVLHHMKFDPVGAHSIKGHALNMVEQINQTWTYAVALAATRQLLELHSDAGSFHLAPSAHASRPLDIMSVIRGLVGAETFAAVDPANNRKPEIDRVKMAARAEQHRYLFFMSPKYPGAQRCPKLERDGVQTWSVDV